MKLSFSRTLEKANVLDQEGFVKCIVGNFNKITLNAADSKTSAFFVVEKRLSCGAVLLLCFKVDYEGYLVSLNIYSRIEVFLTAAAMKIGKCFVNLDSKLADLLSEEVKNEVKKAAEEEFEKTCSYFKNLIERGCSEEDTD